MPRRIFEVNIKTTDNKGHVNIWTLRDIHADSIKFRVDDKEPIPKKEEPKKETPKKSKSKK